MLDALRILSTWTHIYSASLYIKTYLMPSWLPASTYNISKSVQVGVDHVFIKCFSQTNCFPMPTPPSMLSSQTCVCLLCCCTNLFPLNSSDLLEPFSPSEPQLSKVTDAATDIFTVEKATSDLLSWQWGAVLCYSPSKQKAEVKWHGEQEAESRQLKW